MTQEEKFNIQNMLNEYVGRYSSQAKAAASLINVSEATVINIRKGNFDNISEAMWLNLGKQIGLTKSAWKLCETSDYKTLKFYFDDARQYSNVFAITAPAGSGKTATAESYAAQNPNVYHIECAQFFNRKIFLGTLLRKMGKDNTGYNVAEMIEEIVDTLRKQDSPLIILDEADKLSDEVLYFFITLYNMLKGKCGIILMATEHLEKKMQRGRRLNKRGYSEIFSRIGRKFIKLRGTSKTEVEEICKANGVADIAVISEMYNDYEGDLRRIERAIHKSKVINSRKAA